MQRKLLHALEAGEVWPLGAERPVRTDVRLVVATNVPLASLVEKGELLPDIPPRFGLMRVRIPALRDRVADIPELVLGSIAGAAPSYGYAGSPPDVEPDLMTAFTLWSWPGNHRELDATMRLLLALACREKTLTLAMCDDHEALDYLPALVKVKRQWTPQEAVDAVRRSGGNQAKAGRAMGLTPMQIGRLLARARVELRAEEELKLIKT